MNDLQQQNYTYTLSAPKGQQFHPEFKPELTPKEMLELGVFGGWYLNDCQNEFPAEWFKNARLSENGPDKLYNYFDIAASQSLEVWLKKAGYTKMILVVGFSGIAVTTWAEDWRNRRSSAN